ncbi:MAG: hypothetical protein AAF629_37225 [Chloroflexota bacterium]
MTTELPKKTDNRNSEVIFYNCTPHEITIQINDQRVDERLKPVDPINNYLSSTFQNTRIRRYAATSSREIEFATETQLEIYIGRRPSKPYTIEILPENTAIDVDIVVYIFMDHVYVMETGQGQVIWPAPQ